MNNSIEYSGLYWMNIILFLNEFWIEIFKTDRPGLGWTNSSLFLIWNRFSPCVWLLGGIQHPFSCLFGHFRHRTNKRTPNQPNQNAEIWLKIFPSLLLLSSVNPPLCLKSTKLEEKLSLLSVLCKMTWAAYCWGHPCFSTIWKTLQGRQLHTYRLQSTERHEGWGVEQL